MAAIEGIFERVCSFGIDVDTVDTINKLFRGVHDLDMNIRCGDSFPEVDSDIGTYIQLNICDIIFELFIMCGKRGIGLDVLCGHLERQLGFRMHDGGVSVLVPRPVVTNTDNTLSDGVKEVD